MMPPGFAPAGFPPQQGFPPPGFAAPPNPGIASRPPPAPARQPTAPRIVRGQGDDPQPQPAPSRPALLTLPTPEELGVAAARTAGNSAGDEWAAGYRRLDQLGATCFHVERLPQGGHRVSCLLPTAQPSRTHRIDVLAPTAAEAIRLAVERAEEWAERR